MDKNIQSEKIGVEELIATVKAGPRKGNSGAERLVMHVGKNGMEDMMIFETIQNDHIYWLIGQKTEVNEWNVFLSDPNGTYVSSSGTQTDEEFVSTVQDINSQAEAILTVEALDIVPITANNEEFKLKHLSKKLDKERDKNDTNRTAIILVSLAIVGLFSGLFPIMLGIYLGIGAYYWLRFMYEELIPEMGIFTAILMSLLMGGFYIFIWPFGKPWKEGYMRKVKAKKNSRREN